MNERIDLPTLLALLERYYECSLSDEDEHRLRGIIATTRLRHPAIDEARAVMGFRRARRATKGNFAARWKVPIGRATPGFRASHMPTAPPSPTRT